MRWSSSEIADMFVSMLLLTGLFDLVKLCYLHCLILRSLVLQFYPGIELVDRWRIYAKPISRSILLSINYLYYMVRGLLGSLSYDMGLACKIF